MMNRDPANIERWENRLGNIARAKCKIDFSQRGSEGDVLFIRKHLPNEARFSMEGGMNDAELEQGAKVCGQRLDKQAATLGLPLEMEDVSQEIPRCKYITVNGERLEVPEDYDENEGGRTTNERFDALQDAFHAVNRDLLMQERRPHVCQIWGTVKTVANKELNIVSDEAWTATKFIYRPDPINSPMFIMKSIPDDNGHGGGEEIMIDSRQAEDMFPELFEETSRSMAVKGYRSLAAFNAEIKSVVGGRREFARVLSDMSNQSLVGARAEAIKVAGDEKESFYGSKKGFGLF